MAWTDGGALRHALHDLLERERALILAGDFDGLARLAVEKDAGFAALGRQSDKTGELEGARQSALRNQSLLKAAARGLRAARARLEALEHPAASLRTYGRDGVPCDLAGTPKGFSRRA